MLAAHLLYRLRMYRNVLLKMPFFVTEEKKKTAKAATTKTTH